MEAGTFYRRVLTELCRRINEAEGTVIVGIDGRCCGGKTTLAQLLQEIYPDANVFHADDYFLRPFQRTEERLSEPGGNFDRERFEEEILIPVSQGKTAVFRPYRCREQALGEPISAPPARINFVEGAYCLHPSLRKYYTMTVFLDIVPELQTQRLLRRAPERYEMFRDRWIPMEEAYHRVWGTQRFCELSFCAEKETE